MENFSVLSVDISVSLTVNIRTCCQAEANTGEDKIILELFFTNPAESCIIALWNDKMRQAQIAEG